jgi:hypothetical protein
VIEGFWLQAVKNIAAKKMNKGFIVSS